MTSISVLFHHLWSRVATFFMKLLIKELIKQPEQESGSEKNHNSEMSGNLRKMKKYDPPNVI